jgi:peroxiredoxin-like protein
MASIHEYPVAVDWNGGRTGSGSVTATRSGTQASISVPPEFNGPGNGANPEELLTCAIASCYAMTFGIIVENQKLPVSSLRVDAVGEVEQAGAQFTYRKVTLKPRITVSSDITDEQLAKVNDMSHKADSYCIITNAVRGKVEIVVEQEIVRG